MKQWHLPRIRALLEGGVDLLGLETIPCKAEAEMLVKLLKTECPEKKAWLTFSVRVSSISFVSFESLSIFNSSNYEMSLGHDYLKRNIIVII